MDKADNTMNRQAKYSCPDCQCGPEDKGNRVCQRADKTVTMINPPGGRKFGFPKELPFPIPSNIKGWLVKNGYPQEEIDSYGNNFRCRYWGQDV